MRSGDPQPHGPSRACIRGVIGMTSARRQELQAIVWAQRDLAAELQQEWRRARRRARDFGAPSRISDNIWVLLRIARELSGDTAASELLASHVLKHRCGKRAPPGNGPASAPPPALEKPNVVAAAARHRAAAVQSPLAWRAAHLVAEARVALRINDANARGSSPKVAEVAGWLLEEWPLAERRGRFQDFRANMSRLVMRKAWAQRFRKRWHIRLRILPWRSDVPPETQSRKVFWRTPGAKMGPESGPKNGARKRTQKWGPPFPPASCGAPFLGPVFGPICGPLFRPFWDCLRKKTISQVAVGAHQRRRANSGQAFVKMSRPPARHPSA